MFFLNPCVIVHVWELKNFFSVHVLVCVVVGGVEIEIRTFFNGSLTLLFETGSVIEPGTSQFS